MDVHIRVSPVLAPAGTFLQRHVFPSLDDAVVEALCHHFAVAADLRDDDEQIPLCPLCTVLHGLEVAEQHGIDLFSDDADWR